MPPTWRSLSVPCRRTYPVAVSLNRGEMRDNLVEQVSARGVVEEVERRDHQPPLADARLGDVVGFFVHSTVVDSGSNTTYTITKIAFARLVLTGDPDGTGYQVVVQPLVFSDPSVGLDPNAPSSAGMVGRVALVK